MNNVTTFQMMNPLQKTIEEGEEIIRQILEAADALEACIVDEQTWRARWREATDTYEVAETDELAEVIILAQQKEGPLAGIAVSGKGHDIILTKLKNDLKSGKLARLWNSAENTRRNCELAKLDLQRAEERFNALRKVADIKTAVLKASSI